MQIKHWITAFRLRTLPLSLSCVGMGAVLAAERKAFRTDLFLLCLVTTVFLQILSNLANDYGDSVHGADHHLRTGPKRMVQSGIISLNQMRFMVIVFALLSFVSGIALLWTAFHNDLFHWLVFLALGLLSIVAAITYTAGRKPYGYTGLGDLAVLIFFGFVGVDGSAYLFTRSFHAEMLLPALSCGLLAVGVLNINNLRDLESDAAAGKKSIPVRFGRKAGQYYHAVLIVVSVLSAAVYVMLNYRHVLQWLFLLVVPVLLRNVMAVAKKPSHELDPWLRQLAISTLIFVVLFAVGTLLS
ncbi:MAG: 1,4-dihydroxy-2-naphthoate polyprenyltransferase [Cyclobacteriaceae bacterium]|nr:1,4-dihydroxy-2-naphthoate polyprenyltransferase [Cyclobacteriaceae bacterium]MDW8330047.1 1,4-dihydroxy-2-naphthoate polyprenyltransferase [Cyclobacteriaceae bacterium]